MNDRIKLAEAMGWQEAFKGAWIKPGASDDSYAYGALPDPFTDANDDYAVLEWMRGKYAGNEDDTPWDSEWFTFKDALGNAIDYEIGDYARAALKVIS